jgi:hypothetical protein
MNDPRVQLNDLANIQDYADFRVSGHPQRLYDGMGMSSRVYDCPRWGLNDGIGVQSYSNYARWNLNDDIRMQSRMFGYPRLSLNDGIGMQARISDYPRLSVYDGINMQPQILDEVVMNRHRDGRNLNLIRDLLDVRSDIQPTDIVMARLVQGLPVPIEILVSLLAHEKKWNHVSDEVIRRVIYDIAMNHNSNDMVVALLDNRCRSLLRNGRDVGNVFDQVIGNRRTLFRNPDVARQLAMQSPIDPVYGVNSFPGNGVMNPLAQVIARNNFGDQYNNIRGFSAAAFPLSSLALNDFSRYGSVMNPAAAYQPMGMAF